MSDVLVWRSLALDLAWPPNPREPHHGSLATWGLWTHSGPELSVEQGFVESCVQSWGLKPVCQNHQKVLRGAKLDTFGPR